jgi:hypothetical protein
MFVSQSFCSVQDVYARPEGGHVDAVPAGWSLHAGCPQAEPRW